MDIPKFAIVHKADGYYWHMLDDEGTIQSEDFGPFSSREAAHDDATDTIDAALDMMPEGKDRDIS